jgi:acyl-CoA thioester hydrolase
VALMPSPSPKPRSDYPHFLPIQTRWMDNDVYGHVNNVVYYSYFDTVINEFLIGAGLDIHAGPVIGLCVESSCQYLQPAAFPDALTAGLKVAHVGRSSVVYEIGIFRGDETVAQGRFVHVFVDRITRRSVELPDFLRVALSRLA